jgi:hypothetical protein
MQESVSDSKRDRFEAYEDEKWGIYAMVELYDEMLLTWWSCFAIFLDLLNQNNGKWFNGRPIFKIVKSAIVQMIVRNGFELRTCEGKSIDKQSHIQEQITADERHFDRMSNTVSSPIKSQLCQTALYQQKV